MKGLTIGQVAKRANVNIETVRYYEKIGLFSAPLRTESGYRLFPPEVIERIKFIKRVQDLGFTLSEIKRLLTIADGEKFDCQEVQQFANQKIKEIESKITDLESIKSVLEEISKKCPGQGPVSLCPILEGFKKGGDLHG